MLFKTPPHVSNPHRKAINAAFRMDETACIERLLQYAELSKSIKQRVANTAQALILEMRKQRKSKNGLDAFLYQYDLSTAEGVTLMCLAEALLRIPDNETIDKLIRDKVATADWEAHLGKSESLFVNAATWGLMLSGKIMSPDETKASTLTKVFKKLVARTGEPLIRTAVVQAMRILGKQFVMGETMSEALKRAKELEAKGYRYSYDMLGEAARTAKDAERYLRAYEQAIAAVAKVAKSDNIFANPAVSVKLSALYPRYEYSHREEAIKAVSESLLSLAKDAKRANINLTVDAEEADRLELSLDIFETVFADESLSGWQGLGLAIQAYQKRCWYLLDWLVQLSHKYKRRIPVRLVKGAYWDSEIKWTQEKGLEGYPVFTRKASTDVSYLACAKKILANTDALYPQFATHNAYTVATIFELAGTDVDYEFQCLHGMGRALYDQIVGSDKYQKVCRIYAPVGVHEDLLPYLVRRLLENGANTSFVNRLADEKAPIEELIADPMEKVRNFEQIEHPKIPLPINLYGSARKNSRGLDLTNVEQLIRLDNELEEALKIEHHAYPSTVAEGKLHTQASGIYDPSDRNRLVGWVTESNDEDIEKALRLATDSAFEWSQTPVHVRAGYLNKFADLLESHRADLMALAIREAGKYIPDAVAEVREAVDFCRYYAALAKEKLITQTLSGPTGEANRLQMHGRGPMLCISPWNFPLAIFTGQVVACLVAGNPVLAKPAEQTPLIARLAVELLYKAGIPKNVLHFLPGRGEVVGAKLVSDLRIKGVVFTGSTETAWIINKTLAERGGPIVPLIAETGGQNAMIVDSSALPEQAVTDILSSAFYSAGQRCSALRVLFVQEDIANKLLDMLAGAMAELKVGDPGLLETDIGPVIDADAQAMLMKHAELMNKEAELLCEVCLGKETQKGTFFGPRAYVIKDLQQLKREVFGPILHIIRFKAKNLSQVVDSINKTGYGLTLGIQSRINETVEYIQSRVKVGNCYVNRNIIGAVVGVQPFGGEGLSGTGPKAGGPHYLTRLCAERSIAINTAAAGGNASLMTLGE